MQVNAAGGHMAELAIYAVQVRKNGEAYRQSEDANRVEENRHG
jgi:hypothetical protein